MQTGRRIHAVWCLISALTSLCVIVSVAAADSEVESSRHGWPSFLGPNGDGSSNETGVMKAWSANGPPVAWSIAAGSGYGACSVQANRCFLFDREGDQARLRCLKCANGELIWSYEYPSDYEDAYGFDNGPRTSPVLDGDYAYVFGAEGQLHCVRVEDGKKVWSVDTAAEFGVVQNFFGVGSTPIVAGKKLLVMVGGSPPEDHAIPTMQLDRVSPNGSCIVAFDKRTGEVLYQVGDDLASYSSIRVTQLGERRVALAFARSGLLGVDIERGTVLFDFPWRARKLESVNAASPLVRGDEVFITESYELGGCKLKLSLGEVPKVLWRDQPESRERILASHWMTPVLVDGFLYGCSGESNSSAELRCVNWRTGEVMWSQKGLARHSILAVDDSLLVVNEFGQLWLVEANSKEFKVIAESKNLGAEEPLLEKPVWAAPVLSQGRLYLRGAGRLVCAELIPQVEE